ncbi:RHS repeat-associated core domain-containing protein [Streptomyces sp. NPDC059382]|uniref:RHS repeat-associated core domain-containing protein n=1 Tax=Streptomyces sp. NPDC059382 TaxID=3346816 RepID=UPI0036BA6D38
MAGGVDAAQFTWGIGYDAAGNVISETDPLGNKVANAYDGLGNLLEQTDPQGKKTAYSYDALSRPVQVTTPDGGVTKMAFDLSGNLTTRTDANQRITTFEYDKVGRRTKMTDPLSRVTQYAYDPDGNRTQVTNARGQTMTNTYDGRGLLGSTTYSDGTPKVSYTYDNAGRPSTITDGTGTRTIAYDKASRPLTITAPGSAKPFTYTYRADGTVSSRTYPDGRTTSYAYDADGRMTGQTQNSRTATYGWDPAGNLLTTVVPTTPATTETRTYDQAGRMASMTEGAGVRQFVRDGSGRVVTDTYKDAATTGYPKRYEYDAAGRVTRACGDTSSTVSCLPGTTGERYTYDKAGNRLTATLGGTTTTNVYDAADQMTRTTTGTTVTDPTYDADGNLTKDATGTYTYDALGRPRTTTIGADTFTFGHDADGNRTSTKKNGALFRSAQWDVNADIPKLATYLNADGSLRGDYHYGPQGEPQGIDTTASSFYYLHDRQNSITAVKDLSGVETQSYAYGTWGTSTSKDGGGTKQDSAFGFTGLVRDPAFTGVRNQTPAREYDPKAGRFTSPDPRPETAQAANSSPYAYANNDPVNQSDPSGACPLCVSAGIGAAFGAVIEGGIYTWHHRDGGFTASGLGKAAGRGAIVGGVAGLLMPGAGNVAARGLGLTGGRALATSTAVNAGVGAGFSYAVNEANCRPTDPWDLLIGATSGASSSLIGPAFTWLKGRFQPQAQVPRRFGPGAAHADDPALRGAGFSVNSIPEEPGFRYLYRGISELHPGYDDAVQGVSIPRGGSVSMETHHSGNTDSIYTSWDTNRNTALRYARGAAEGRSDLPGVILQVKLPIGQPIYPSMMFSSDLWEGTESLVEGAVRGAKVWHVPAP